MKPRVTIAIPTYNRIELLRKAIDSALNQDYENIEVIVSDNNSSDGTVEYLQKIVDPRIRILINSTNIGMVGNWERCLNSSNGDYFLLLSDDDELRSDAISKLLNPFLGKDGRKVGFVFSDFYFIRDNKKIYANINEIETKFIAADLIVKFYLHKIYVFPCASLLRRSDLIKIGGYLGFNAKLAVDACAWHEISFCYPFIVRVPEPLAFYRIHPSLSSSMVDTWDSDFITIKEIINKNSSLMSSRQFSDIQKNINIAYNKVPIGYISRKFREDKNYNIINLANDIFKWRKRIFTRDNFYFIGKKIIEKYFS